MLQHIGPRQRECLSRAAHCRELAENAADPGIRAEYLKMEKSWLRLADSYQFSERLNRFVADKGSSQKPA
jgi:hypothetical protein